MPDGINEGMIRKICFSVIENLSRHLGEESVSSIGREVAKAIVKAVESEKEESIKEEIISVCLNLHQQGFFAGTSGNVSARVKRNEFLITPSGLKKGEISSNQLIKMNLGGKQTGGDLSPSSEYKMHLIVYRKREDVGAIVHAHPPFATGFAAAGIPLDNKVLPEAILVLGRIPLVEYGTPSTWEVPGALDPYLEGNQAFLLMNHGALTLGKNLHEAAHRMETLELFAKVILIARMLGGEKLLTDEQLNKLATLSPDK